MYQFISIFMNMYEYVSMYRNMYKYVSIVISFCTLESNFRSYTDCVNLNGEGG